MRSKQLLDKHLGRKGASQLEGWNLSTFRSSHGDKASTNPSPQPTLFVTILSFAVFVIALD